MDALIVWPRISQERPACCTGVAAGTSDRAAAAPELAPVALAVVADMAAAAAATAAAAAAAGGEAAGHSSWRNRTDRSGCAARGLSRDHEDRLLTSALQRLDWPIIDVGKLRKLLTSGSLLRSRSV